jgi:endonuclease YncB( thermonuclease family)
MRQIAGWLFLGLLAAGCNQPPSTEEELYLEKNLRAFGYRVISILDGQTLIVDLNDRGLQKEVRLIGVGVPKYSRKPEEFREAGGEDAGSYLWSLVAEPGPDGKTRGMYVQLGFEGWRHGRVTSPKTFEPLPDAAEYPTGAVVNDRDQVEAYVFVKGHCVNRLMIDSGYAWVDRRIPFSRMGEFVRAEARAQALRVGYWQWNPPGRKAAEAATPAKPAEGGEGEEGGKAEGGGEG